MDWLNPKTKLTAYFTVGEALTLPQWNRMADASDGLTEKHKANLIKTFLVMDKIRGLLGKPIIVHVAYRPPEYNKLVKGAKQSAHLFGLAVDFHAVGMTCDEVRVILEPKLLELNIRMEDLDHSNWVHIDTKTVPPGGVRLFKA